MLCLPLKLATPLAISNRGNHKARRLRAIRFCLTAAIKVPTKYGRGIRLTIDPVGILGNLSLDLKNF
jgi:hypothetical protein